MCFVHNHGRKALRMRLISFRCIGIPLHGVHLRSILRRGGMVSFLEFSKPSAVYAYLNEKTVLDKGKI